ncbi:unnamed protein product [Calypogeia fissa]
MDDYEAEEKKQAAISVLSNYSQFVMACIGEGVTPHQLRLHLMKEITGMPTSLDPHKAPLVRKGEAASSSSEASSSTDANKPSEASSHSERPAVASSRN